MLAPVLSLWGQDNAFDYDKVVNAVNQLKRDQGEVVRQSKEAEHISAEYKAKADSVLTETFKCLDSLLNVYKQVEQDEELKTEIQTSIINFITEYRKAISHPSEKKINIGTNGFIIVAENYSAKFNELNKKAENYLLNNNAASAEVKSKDSTKNADDRTGDYALQKYNDKYILNWWIVLAIVIALISLGLNILTLIKIEKKARAIKDNRLQIEELERTLTHKIKGIQGSSAQDSSYQSKPNKYAPTHGLYTGIQQSKKGRPGFHQVIKENPNVEKGDIKPTETQHSGNKQTVHKQPEVTYLYATIKAQSPLAEFVKVTGENAGDKIFMLKLDNPEADTAEFTISDMMTSDFMKSVILDRDTYLKVQFCDKAIVSANPTKIIVETPGKAKKVDGKWMVQDRMTLRLV